LPKAVMSKNIASSSPTPLTAMRMEQKAVPSVD
jgi:hypothetical protein